jgi:hypothetical protein
MAVALVQRERRRRKGLMDEWIVGLLECGKWIIHLSINPFIHEFGSHYEGGRISLPLLVVPAIIASLVGA